MRPRHEKDTNPEARIPAVMAALRDSAIAFRLIEALSAEADSLADWIESHFPIVGSQIDWSRVRGTQRVEWSETAEVVEAFRSATTEFAPDLRVVVTWSDALCPSLEMRLVDAMAIAHQTFEASWDTWIVSLEENWCFECHHEGTSCFGWARPDVLILDSRIGQGEG